MAVEPNTDPTSFNFLSRLGAFLGMGDDGTSGSMTVPTALNTNINNWQPPGSTAPTSTGSGLGLNLGTGQLALSGLSSLANIWGALQQNTLAKDQFKLQKDVLNTNLNNQIQSYNTSLEDRMNARGASEGRSAEYTADEIARRRLTR